MSTKICPHLSRAELYKNLFDDLLSVPCQGSRCAWWHDESAHPHNDDHLNRGRCGMIPDGQTFDDPARGEAE